MALENDYRREFFDDLVSQGVTFAGTTDYAEFEKAMQDPVRSRKLYNKAIDKGWELDDYPTWLEDYGPAKASTQPIVESQSIPTQGNVRKPAYNEYPMATAANSAADDEAKVNLAVNTMAGWNAAANDGYATYQAESDNEPDVAASPMYGPGGKAGNRVWNTSAPAAKRAASADPVEAIQAGATESGANALTEEQINAMEMENVAKVKAAREKEYQDALAKYGGEEGIAAEEQRRLEAAGVVQPKAKTGNEIDDLVADYQGEIDQQEEDLKKYNPDYKMDVTLNPNSRNDSFQQAVASGNGTQFGIERKNSAVISELATKNFVQKIYDRTEAGKPGKYLTIHDFNDKNRYSKMYTRLTDDITEEDMQQYVKDAFGYDYSNMSGASRKMFRDVANGQMAAEVFSKAAAEGKNLTGTQSVLSTFKNSLMASTLDAAITNWFGNDEMQIGYQAAMEKFGKSQEMLRNNHWYGGALIGAAGGVGMITDLAMLSGFMRWGTGFMSTPLVYDASTYGRFVPGVTGTMSDIIRSAITRNPYVVGLINSAMPLAKNYIEFAKLGAMSYVLQSAADPVTRDEIKNMYKDLDGVNGWLSATGQVVGNGLVGTLDAAHEEGITGAQLAVIGNVVGVANNSLVNNRMLRSYNRTIAKNYSEAAARMNAARIGRNYQALGVATSVGVESGYFTWKNINENIDAANEQIDEYNRTHKDKKNYVTFVTYDNKAEDFLQSLGMIVGMKAAGGQLILPKFLGNVHKERAFIGNKLMKSFNMELTEDDFSYLNDVGFGEFHKFDHNLVASLCTPRFVDEDGNKSDTWYEHIVDNNLVPFETMRKLRLALEDKVVVAGHTVDDNGKVIPTMDVRDVVTDAKVEKLPNGRWALVGTDIHGMPVMNLSYDTEREANAHLDKMNGLIADNARRQAELLMGDRVDMVKKAVEKWAIDNDVDPEYAQWMFMEYVTHRENALEDNAAMADEVRTAVAKEVVENRAKYIDEVRKLMTKKSGVDFDVLFGKDLDRITDSDIETLNAYTQMLLDWKKDMTTDPRILEVEKTSDMESGVQKRGIYDGRNVYYIGDLNNDKVYVIDPDTGNRTKVNSSEVQHVSESPVKDVIDQNVSTYDPDKGPQEGNIVWTIDNATGEWYQGVVKSYDADNVEITSDGKITKVIDKSVVERDQIRHAEYDKQQQLNEEQQGQNQIGAEAGSQQWMEVDGVLKPIRSAEERGDMMHVEYEDGTFEDVTFDEYQSRMRDVAAEQQQQQQKLEAQKQQKIAEVNGLNTLDDINNWRSGQDGAIDADVESELIKREKLIRDNHRAQTLQRVENAGLDELLALEKENEQWKDSQVASAIDWKKTDELSKISDASYQKGAGAFTDDKVQAEYDKGLENIDDTIESIKRGIGDIDRWLDYSPSDKRRAELEGSKRALEEGLSKMNEARARFVAEEQNMAAIEMEEYKKASGESDIFDNEDINDLARLAQMNFEVANDKSGKYSKEVIAKAKGRLRAITERRNWLKQEQEKYANSAEGKIDSAIKDINKSASLKDLEDVLNNNTEDEVKNDAKFKNAFEAKKKQLLISETPSEFADRMKEGLSDADKKKVDNILSIRNYNEIKNKAKTDAVAKKVSDAIEEALNAIAKDPSNMTYDEVENLFKLKNKDKDAAALFDKVMAAIKGTGVKVSIVPYLKDALGDEDWAGQVRLSADNQIWNNNKGYDHASQTLLHELIHVVTSEAIEYVEYNERGKDRYNLNGKQKSFNLTPEMIEGAREICKLWDILVRSKQAKGIFDKKPWNSKEWYDYGMKNPNEMVAEMANPAFRSKLKQMNLWHKMVDGVLKMFGVKKDNPDMTNNAYEQLFSSLEKILSNWTPQKGWSSDQGDVTGKLKITSDKPRETWQDRALASLKRFSEIKAEDIATASRNQREVARENWGDKRLKLVEKLADAMGLKLRFVYSVADGKANAQIENGEILIESTNDNPLKFLMGHEVMHHLRQNAPNVYESYLKTMRNIVGEGAFKRALDEQRKLYKEHKIAKSEDKLIEEVVADQSGALMENADLFESFVREMAEAGKPALLRRVNDVLEKINDFLAGVSDDFAGVNAHDLMRVAQIKAERDQLKKIYEQGLREAQKNWKERNLKRMTSAEEGVDPKMANELADADLVQDGGVVIGQEAQELKEATGYKTPMEIDGADYSYKTKGDWMLSFLGENPDERRKMIASAVDRWYEKAAADDILAEYMSHSDYPDGDLNRDGTGPLRGNVEYRYTFDLDTTCPRTYQYLSIADKIEQRIGRPLTQREAIILIETMRGYGQMIPCTYCYAENKRQALKDYFNNFMTFRRNVLNAKDEKTAYREMYGHTKKSDKNSPISAAAEEVLKRWRSKEGLSNWNPDIKTLVDMYYISRSFAMAKLDEMEADMDTYKDFDVNTSDQKAVNMLAKELGWNHGEDASFEDANAVATLKDFINEWRYDKLEGIEHPRMVERPAHFVNGMNDIRLKYSMALWNEMCRYGASASSAHNSVRYYPYTNELQGLKAEDKEYINNMGGLRMHSTNDFRLDYVGDYFQLIADMEKGGWFGHTYTKNSDFVRIFGNTGYRINMSLAAYDENGKVVENPEEGFGWEEAKRMRKLYKNAGAMMMTTSKAQLSFALNSDWIDMIIPFHSSGLPKEVTKMRGWEDAQSRQNEKYYSKDYKRYLLLKEHGDDLKARGINLPKSASAAKINPLFEEYYGKKETLYKWEKKGEWTKTKVAPHFLPHGTTIEVCTDEEGVNKTIKIDGWHKKGETEAQDLQRYMDLCKQYGVMPRFFGMKCELPDGTEIEAIDHPNYLKLVKETARMDTQQEAVRFNLNEPNQGFIEELGLYGGVDPSTCKNAWFDKDNNIWRAKDPKTGEISNLDYSTGKAWTPMAWAMNEMRTRSKKNGGIGVTRDEQVIEGFGVIDDFMKNVIDYEKQTGNKRELDYLSPNARQYWNLNVRAANSAKLSDEQAMRAAVPYHRAVPEGDGTQYSLKNDQVKSENFKRWFGDWENDPENASKVVDENGKPMVVHHGTSSYGFTVFNTSAEWNGANVGSHFGGGDIAREFGNDGQVYNVYLDIKKPWETFDWFADIYDNAYLDALSGLVKEIGTQEARDMMLNGIKKIYTYADPAELEKAMDESFMDIFPDDDGLFENGDVGAHVDNEVFRDKTVQLIRDIMKLGGYDGIKYENWYEHSDGDANQTCWIALEPRQIKSADIEGEMANNGEFDSENPDIRYSLKEANNKKYGMERGKNESYTEFAERMKNPSPVLKMAKAGAQNEEETTQYSLKINPKKLKELENLKDDEVVYVYRAMILGEDGNINPPMSDKGLGSTSSKKNATMTETPKAGSWEESEEHPELINENGKIWILTDDGQQTQVAYNPYYHTSRTMLNDQFAAAWRRPRLVTVRCAIPKSELTSGYHADRAKDSVGEIEWNEGPVSKQLKGDKKRRVILTRWCKPIEVVDLDEYAQAVKDQLEGSEIGIPFNAVTPQQRDALVRAGVKIVEPVANSMGKNGKESPVWKAYEEWLNGGGDTPDGGNKSYSVKRHERTGWTEKNYGVPYQGSKNQVADELIKVLPKGKRFVDLFSGGGAMSHAMALSGNVESVHMNDKAPFGQQLFLDAMEGKYHDYDRKVTPEEFKEMRYTSEGLMHSYNGNARSYAADTESRSKAQEQINRVKALEKMKDKRGMFTSSELDYRDVELKDGDVIYADIPYENTGNTSYSKAGKFDMKAFTDWAAGLDKPVYVSSFEAPEGFTEIWSSDRIRGFRAGTSKVEKLFVQDRFADEEKKRIDAAKPMTDSEDAQYSIGGIRGALRLDEKEGTTIRMDNLDVAKKMEEELKPMWDNNGLDPDENVAKIWAATGWSKGKDGEWRFEMPDAKWKDGAKLTRAKKLSTIVDAPEIFAAYPDMKDITVRKISTREFVDTMADGMYDHDENELKLYLSDVDELGERQLMTLLHEMQHAIQNREGFATGGSESKVRWNSRIMYEQLNAVSKDLFDKVNGMEKEEVDRLANELGYSAYRKKSHINELYEQARKNLKENSYEYGDLLDDLVAVHKRVRTLRAINPSIRGLLSDMEDAKAMQELYESIAGEVEARNVVRRNSLSDDMKRDLPPSFSEDYTRKEQTIVERGDIDDTQYSLKNPLKDNPWTAGKKQRGEGWKQINEMHNFIDSFWNWGKYADADDVKESVKKLTQFVKGNLTKELGTRIGSARIKTLLTNINKATQKQDLNGPVRTIQKMLNEAEIELELKDMLKLFDIQLQRKDNRGVVVPKWVDDNTRKVYDAVRATYGKMMQTSKDAEIAAKSKDIAEVHKDLLDKLRNYGIDPNTWNGADYKGNNWDVLSDADKDELRNLRNSYGALENERQILKQEREQLLLGQNLTETERELAQLRADLEQREMDNAIDPNVEWTEADKDMLYVVMPMRERLLNMRERYADLKQLEENWKNELAVLDNISRGPGYMARRAQQRDVVWAAEDAYIQKQKEIAAATREINDAMKNILTQGAERLKDWKEQEALHKGHMIRMTLDDFGRKRPLMKGEKSTKRSIKNIITAVQDFIDMPLQSLQFILSNDQNHLGGEGNLYRYFFKDPNTSIVTAWDNKRIATEENGAVLDDMVEKIWKGKVASMTGKDKAVDLLWNGRRPIKNLQALYGDMQSELGVEIERFMSQDEVDSNNKYGYQGRTDWTTNDTFKEGMTKGHALYLWLTWRQADGKMKMAKMGYTDKSMDAIENALGKEYIKFGEWLTEDFLPHLRDSKYNPRHVEIFGSSMNNTPHYFPLKIDKDQIRPKGGIEDIQSQFMPSLSTPNLISRMNNTAAIDPKADALEVLKGYLESMEQWHAMAPILRDFNAIHASKKVRKAMDASHNGSFNALMEAAQVATASQYEQRGLKAVDNLMKTFNRIVAAGARGHIAFRGMTAVKQLFSYDAFRAYSNDPKFQLDLSKNFCMPAAAMEWAMENMPSFRERASKGDIGLEGMNDYDDMNSFVKKYGENGMWMNKLFDQWAVAAGAKSVYDLMVKRKEAEFRRSNAANLTNYTNAEIKKLAHEWAINEAEICYNQSQQSSRNEFSSPLQKTGNSIVRPFMLFQNANIGYRRQSVTNLYNLYKLATREVTDREGNSLSSKEKARSAFASAFGFVMFGALLHQTWNLAGNTNHIYNYFADNLTDEEKEGYLRSTLLGIFTNGTTFGAPIASWANGYEWEPYEIYNEVKGMIDLYKSDKHDADELSRKIFYNLAMYTGGVNIETWENIFDGAKNLILDGGMMADKAIDFSILLNMNKTDRKGWAKALMQKYGPTEFAKGFKAAERSSSKADRTDELAKAWIQKMDNDFYEEMENIRSFEKKINGIREEAKKECQKNGADTDKILEEATKQIQDLMNGDDYARLKEFIASGNYDMYKMLMKSVRANIRYENSEGAPANENTQQISDKNIINEMNKLIAKSKELIK